jgi:ketosteroid isomerase-like protein
MVGSSGADPEAMKRYLGAVERKDWQAATAFRADDDVLHFPGRSPFSGDFVGKEVFLERYDRLREELGGTIELAEVREVLMGSVRVVALVTERAMRGERTLEFERVNVYSWAGGEITEIRTHDYNPSALEEFWS